MFSTFGLDAVLKQLLDKKRNDGVCAASKDNCNEFFICSCKKDVCTVVINSKLIQLALMGTVNTKTQKISFQDFQATNPVIPARLEKKYRRIVEENIDDILAVVASLYMS